MIKNFLRIAIILIPILIIGCKKNDSGNSDSANNLDIPVYDFHDKEALSTFDKLNLDKSHPNLLDPNQSELINDKLLNTWSDLHQNIGNHLAENNFNWNTPDTSIVIWHRFYFHPDGKFKTYFFRVMNESVSEETRKNYTKLISGFFQNNKINIQKDFPFAQCGKTRYPNE